MSTPFPRRPEILLGKKPTKPSQELIAILS